MPDSTTSLNAPRSPFEDRIRGFESQARRGDRQALQRLVESLDCDAAPETARELVLEAIAVEMEIRWRENRRRGRSPRGPQLESYVKRFAQLGSLDDLPLWLVADEYRTRQRFGDAPARADYAARFPRLGPQLEAALDAVDADLHAEGVVPAAEQVRPLATFPHTRIDPQAPLFHGDYSLRRLIGAGGMCKVYTGVQRSLNRPVAIKVLKKASLDDPRRVARFLHEARLAGRLHHPAIVAVHGLGRFPDGGYFMAMDLIEGEDLARLVSRAPVTPDVAARFVAQTAEALAYCHGEGVVHCDVKPSNLLVDTRGQVHLTDFGCARSPASESDDDEIPYRAGTAAFMAPEQIDPRRGPIGPAADIYGLGGVLFTLLSGAPPYAGLDRETILALATAPDQSLTPPIGEDVFAQRLWGICRTCLAKDPGQRYTTAAEVLAALESVMMAHRE